MTNATGDDRGETIRTALLLVIAFILTAGALRASSAVTVPLVLAFFLAALQQPVQAAVARRLPRWLYWVSVLAAMLTMLVGLAVVIGAITLSISVLAGHAPQYAGAVQEYWQRTVAWAQSHHLPLKENLPSGIREYAISWLSAGITSVWSLVAMVVLVFFFVLMMLLEARDWKAKSHEALSGRQAFTVIDIAEAIGQKVRRYLMVRSCTGALTAAIAGIVLWLFGVDFAWVWALQIWVLNYIPYIGPIIGYIPPTLMALLQHGPGTAALALGLMGGADQIIGNILDPFLQGRTQSISPVMLLVSITFWGWVWGPIGALLAAPMLIAIMTLCQHVPALRSVAVLLAQDAEQPPPNTTAL